MGARLREGRAPRLLGVLGITTATAASAALIAHAPPAQAGPLDGRLNRPPAVNAVNTASTADDPGGTSDDAEGSGTATLTYSVRADRPASAGPHLPAGQMADAGGAVDRVWLLGGVALALTAAGVVAVAASRGRRNQ